MIVKAILKYGLSNFEILILEFTDPENRVKTEQLWLDEYTPVYNILNKTRSSLGYKHKPEDLVKISIRLKGKIRSDKVRKEMSERMLIKNLGKKHTIESKELMGLSALRREKKQQILVLK